MQSGRLGNILVSHINQHIAQRSDRSSEELEMFSVSTNWWKLHCNPTKCFQVCFLNFPCFVARSM